MSLMKKMARIIQQDIRMKKHAQINNEEIKDLLARIFKNVNGDFDVKEYTEGDYVDRPDGSSGYLETLCTEMNYDFYVDLETILSQEEKENKKDIIDSLNNYFKDNKPKYYDIQEIMSEHLPYMNLDSDEDPEEKWKNRDVKYDIAHTQDGDYTFLDKELNPNMEIQSISVSQDGVFKIKGKNMAFRDLID